jgi:hypothetical protein
MLQTGLIKSEPSYRVSRNVMDVVLDPIGKSSMTIHLILIQGLVSIYKVHIWPCLFLFVSDNLPTSPAKFPMASGSTVPNVPNPNMPLTFLPPIIAEQFQVSSYVIVGGLSVSYAIGNPCEMAADYPHWCRHLYGTGLCLCQKNTKCSARVDSKCQTSPMSCHG